MDDFGTDALRYYCFREVSLRPGRRRLDDHVRRALRVRARQRLRQPREPHAGDDRPLPRRRRARRRRRPDARARLRRPRRRGLRAARPRRDHAGAGADLAARAPAQPLRRGARAVAARQGRAQAAELDATLRSLAEGIRAVTVLLHPYMPETAAKLLAALGEEELALESARLRRPPRRRGRVGKLAAALPEAAVIDSHTHLDSTPGTRRRDRRRRARGRRHADPHDRHRRRELARGRRPPPRRTSEVWFAGRPPPEQRDAATPTRTPTSCASSRGHPRCAAIGETGLDDFRDYAPRADQERAFAAQIELARELGKPLVIHTRAAEDDTIATLARDAQGLDVILHCFSMPDRLDECLDHGWWISLRRQRHLPEGARPRVRRRARRRSTACSSRPTRRT